MHKKYEINPVLTWNTGEYRSEHGQRMAAVLHEDKVCYMDFDRHLQGSFRARRFEYSTEEIVEFVDYLYNRNLGENDMPTEVRERLEAYEDVVDTVERSQAFSGRPTTPKQHKEVTNGTL